MGKKCVFYPRGQSMGLPVEMRLPVGCVSVWDVFKAEINSETLGGRTREVWGGLWGNGAPSPSRDMPTERHFLKRHCWQRLRLMRTMEQFSFFRHLLYWMFCWMLRRKKPWRAEAATEHLC